MIILFFSNKTVAQSDSLKVIDSTSVNRLDIHKKWYESRFAHESIVPVSLALGSVAIICIPGLKEDLQKTLRWNYNPATTGIYANLYEDQLRYVPSIAAYAISFCGVASRHPFIDKSVILAVSYIASDFIVYNGKMLTKSLRPPGRTYTGIQNIYSLPSQHTAMAFVAATFLDHELGYISPWISAGGYATATWVGIARIANNYHWTSDVLMGAAVGMLMTNATYWAYDGVMKFFPKRLTVSPIIDPNHTGLYFCYKL
ncbi:MAG: phosphatase PAP2 family protein [Bacteroidota bacterium]|nr:phosphatase PAP2 family protein [Bacteroidota bacterium]